MKLRAQYSKATIISSITVLLIAGIGYYFLLNYVLKQQLDDALRVEEVEILDYVGKNNSLPEATTFKDQRIDFKKTESPVQRHFKSLDLPDPEEHEVELCRQLTFPVQINGNYYAAYVTKSQEETEKLIGLVLLITLGLVILLGILLFFFNRFLLERLWRPFYDILSSIKNFDLNLPSTIKVQKTPVDEFNEMNLIVNRMTEKVSRDYQSLKDFTDHASHEIQTPLAVVNSKMDILIQDPGLSEESLRQVQTIYDSVERMSRLCQSLLLLTKIENYQFTESTTVNIKKVAENKLKEIDELISGYSLFVQVEMEETIVSMNIQLAETLVSNLLINAINYSNKHDTIKLSSKAGAFTISNPGKFGLDTSLIFDRFWKSPNSEGTGLGLAIVKKICDIYGFGLYYEFSANSHHFKVEFGNELETKQ